MAVLQKQLETMTKWKHRTETDGSKRRCYKSCLSIYTNVDDRSLCFPLFNPLSPVAQTRGQCANNIKKKVAWDDAVCVLCIVDRISTSNLNAEPCTKYQNARCTLIEGELHGNIVPYIGPIPHISRPCIEPPSAPRSLFSLCISPCVQTLQWVELRLLDSCGRSRNADQRPDGWG